METLENVDEVNNQKGPRPSFLTVLCVLSFISIGLALISGVFGLFIGPPGEEAMMQQKLEFVRMADELRSVDMEGFAVMIEQFQRMIDSLNVHHYANSMTTIVFHLIGLFGVIQMWLGKKLGFHLYIAFSILAIVQMYFFVSPADIPTFTVIINMIISGIFIFMYSRNLKWLS